MMNHGIFPPYINTYFHNKLCAYNSKKKIRSFTLLTRRGPRVKWVWEKPGEKPVCVDATTRVSYKSRKSRKFRPEQFHAQMYVCFLLKLLPSQRLVTL